MKLVKCIGIFLVLVTVMFGVTWAMCAFISWEPNPGYWSDNQRSTVAFAAFMIFMFAGGGSVYSVFKNDI